MKKTFFLIFILLLLSGCGKVITVPIDQTPLSDDDATVIIFHDQGYTDEFKIFLDKKQIGTVTSEKPLKFKVEPGEHELNTVVGANVIDRVTKQGFKAGETYYMRLWLDIGTFVSSIRIDQVDEINSYEVRSHK